MLKALKVVVVVVIGLIHLNIVSMTAFMNDISIEMKISCEWKKKNYD